MRGSNIRDEGHSAFWTQPLKPVDSWSALGQKVYGKSTEVELARMAPCWGGGRRGGRLPRGLGCRLPPAQRLDRLADRPGESGDGCQRAGHHPRSQHGESDQQREWQQAAWQRLFERERPR